MDSTKVQRIGGPRSRSASCAPSFIEEARLMNRQVRLARSRNRLRKFSELTHFEEECIDTYQKDRVPLSNSSDDLQSDCGHSSKSCSNLISVHGRFGGSVEMLDKMHKSSSEVNFKAYRKEVGVERKNGECHDQHPPALLENPESETRWYFKYFLAKGHYNYVGYDAEKSPFLLSVVMSDQICRCILWRKMGSKKLSIRTSNGKIPALKHILEKYSLPKLPLKEITTPEIQKDILTLEEQEGAVNFKFGLLYAKAGQRTDDEMFSNESGSAEFNQFLDLLGERIDLEGWEHFKGGLDTKNNSTGKKSLYTVFQGHEIMFHVSTLLPYHAENKQQEFLILMGLDFNSQLNLVERKRHIGNDIVVIIYIESTDDEYPLGAALSFDPSCIKSKFNHIFAVVTYSKSKNSYRLIVYSAESVPEFNPPLVANFEFSNHKTFKNFLLTKLINGEKAAYSTPVFADKRERTLDLLLKNIEQNYSTKRDIIPSQSGNKKFSKEVEFRDYGQMLKVECISRGNHPTSFRGSDHRVNPFDATLLIKNVAHVILLGDVCSDGSLIVHTVLDGTLLLFPDGGTSLIIDKTVPIAQLCIAHRHNLLLLRTGYSKDNYFCVFPLSYFYSENKTIVNKHNISKFCLPHSKGCHLFCTSLLDGNFLKVALAVKNKVFMWFWKHPALPVAQQGPPSPVDNPVKSFIKSKELPLSDIPIMMTLLDERPSGKLCVAYRQGTIDAINEISGETTRLLTLDSKNQLVSLSAFEENDQCFLLIGYDLCCKVLSFVDGTPQIKVDLIWESEPKYIVYKYPYLLAFTEDAVEIRTTSNGSLVKNIGAPNLHLISYKGDIYFTSSKPIAAHSTVHEVSRIVESGTTSVNMTRKQSSSKLSQVETCCLYKITFDTVQCAISPQLGMWGGSEESLDKISTQSDLSTFSELPTPTSIKTTDSDVFSQQNMKFSVGETLSVEKSSRHSCEGSDNESLKGVESSGSQQLCYPPSPNPKTRKSMLKNLLPNTANGGEVPSELQKNCLHNLDINRSSQRMSILTVKQHFEVCVEPSDDSSDLSEQSDDANDETLLCDKPDSGFNSASSTPSTALLQS